MAKTDQDANGKKKRKSSKKSAPDSPSMVMGSIDGTDILIQTDDGDNLNGLDPLNGTISLPDADGNVMIDFNPEPLILQSKNFDDNLAEHIPEGIMGGLAADLLDAIDEDDRDRADWLDQRAQGIDLLGMKLERPGGSVGSSSAPMDGMSRVRDSLLMENVLRSQATAFAELCPSEGPCKVINYGPETEDSDKLAEDFEKDFNYYLTTIASEYYKDTYSMLGMTVYASGMFKKVYWCPLKERPVSESVDGSDLIVPSNITDIKNAGRITHVVQMRQSIMKQLQLEEVYRDVPLRIPTPDVNVLQQKKADVAGFDAKPQRPEDQTYTVYECYCELDLPGFEHKKGMKGDAKKPGADAANTGRPLPYRVTIDKDSRTVLEIRRNWKDGDDRYRPKIPFVAFPYIIAGFTGFYGIGLLHILGNYAIALTAMLREGIDAGMFANFPGGLIAKGATRQLTNEIRVAPGTLAPVDIGAAGRIQDAIMHLPYNDITQGLLALMQMVADRGMKLGGSGETAVGEGKQDAPVGTTLALIEQQTKIESAVHKTFHAAQAEELRLLRDLFKDDPESLFAGNPRPSLGSTQEMRIQRFKQALENCDLEPRSDPNTPSHMHRLMKATALKQLTMGNPQYNQVAVDERIASMMRIDDFQSLLAPPQQSQPDPMAIAQLQLEAQKVDVQRQGVQVQAAKVASQHQTDQAKIQSQQETDALKIAHQHLTSNAPQRPDPLQVAALHLKDKQLNQNATKLAVDAHNAQADRASSETVKSMDIASRLATHPESQPIVNSELSGLSPFLTPAKQGESRGANPTMAGGGAVDEAMGSSGLKPEDVRSLALAMEIARFLERQQTQGNA